MIMASASGRVKPDLASIQPFRGRTLLRSARLSGALGNALLASNRMTRRGKEEREPRKARSYMGTTCTGHYAQNYQTERTAFRGRAPYGLTTRQ